MRIISGEGKGRRIAGTGRKETRAVTARTKEAIFSMLGNIEGEKVLDLFAGSGSFGIEALSKGAGETTFVDRSQQCKNVIRKNLNSLGFNGKVYACEVKLSLKRFNKRGERYDIIFSDPPFGSGLTHETLNLLDRFNLVNDGGIIITRQHHKEIVPQNAGKLTLSRMERYGETNVILYTKE